MIFLHINDFPRDENWQEPAPLYLPAKVPLELYQIGDRVHGNFIVEAITAGKYVWVRGNDTGAQIGCRIEAEQMGFHASYLKAVFGDMTKYKRESVLKTLDDIEKQCGLIRSSLRTLEPSVIKN